MTEADENELHRLCDMLKDVHEGLVEESPLREAVKKAGFGLSLAFMQGQRVKIEEMERTVGRPLDEVQREHLRELRIDPDGE